MSKQVKIPETMNPFVVHVNNRKYVYPAGTMQEVPDEVATIIENHENATVEPIEEGGGIVHPDWNQNNPSAPDYVKNRPFWTGDPVESVLFDGTFGSFEAELPIEIALTAGQEYTVTLDGVEYVLTARELDGVTCVGSESLFWGNEYVGTEPPFVLAGSWITTVNEGEQHTLKIIGDVVTIHKLDAKYLPYDVSRALPTFTTYIDDNDQLKLGENNPFDTQTGIPMTVERFNELLGGALEFRAYIDGSYWCTLSHNHANGYTGEAMTTDMNIHASDCAVFINMVHIEADTLVVKTGYAEIAGTVN